MVEEIKKPDAGAYVVARVAGFDISSTMFEDFLGMNESDMEAAAISAFADLYELKKRNFEAIFAWMVISNPFANLRTLKGYANLVAANSEASSALLRGWPDKIDPSSFLIHEEGIKLFLEARQDVADNNPEKRRAVAEFEARSNRSKESA